MKKKLYIRRFLNKGIGIAAIEVSGKIPSNKVDSGWVYLGIKITDCNRQINLDFDVSSSKTERQLTLDKLDNLIADFTVARDWLKEACEKTDGN